MGASPTQTEPADWAEFITLAVAGAAANVGSIDRALEGRPGSWEADAVRSMLLSTVGEDSAELLRHRTEPIRVVLRPAEILSDLGYAALYDESRQILQSEQDRHLWRYRLGEDRTWTPLDPGAPDWADAFDDDAGARREPGRHALAPGHRRDGAPVRGQTRPPGTCWRTGKPPSTTCSTRTTPAPTARR